MSLWGISWVQLEREMTERQIMLMVKRANERIEEQNNPRDRPRENPKPRKRNFSETVRWMMNKN